MEQRGHRTRTWSPLPSECSWRRPGHTESRTVTVTVTVTHTHCCAGCTEGKVGAPVSRHRSTFRPQVVHRSSRWGHVVAILTTNSGRDRDVLSARSCRGSSCSSNSCCYGIFGSDSDRVAAAESFGASKFVYFLLFFAGASSRMIVTVQKAGSLAVTWPRRAAPNVDYVAEDYDQDNIVVIHRFVSIYYQFDVSISCNPYDYIENCLVRRGWGLTPLWVIHPLDLIDPPQA